MKTLTLLTLLTTALAAPTTPILTKLLTPLTQKCPSNPAQPTGKLPKDGTSISTSLLLPISSKTPTKSFPASPWASITPNDLCTIFNLDLPVPSTQGKICNLVFDFPSPLQAPGLYTFHGSGAFGFTGYAIGAGAVAGVTTYDNQPAPGPSPPKPPKVMRPGNSYVINSGACGIPGEIPGSVTVSGRLCSGDTTFVFKQSDVFCPLGFYVILTDDKGVEGTH